MLADVNVFAFVYPFWMNAQPAMLKGYIDRVFGMGFAYGMGGRRQCAVAQVPQDDQLHLKRARRPTGSSRRVPGTRSRKLFDEHFAAVCGLELVDHIHFGAIVPGIRADAVTRFLVQVREAVERHF